MEDLANRIWRQEDDAFILDDGTVGQDNTRPCVSEVDGASDVLSVKTMSFGWKPKRR